MLFISSSSGSCSFIAFITPLISRTNSILGQLKGVKGNCEKNGNEEGRRMGDRDETIGYKVGDRVKIRSNYLKRLSTSSKVIYLKRLSTSCKVSYLKRLSTLCKVIYLNRLSTSCKVRLMKSMPSDLKSSGYTSASRLISS